MFSIVEEHLSHCDIGAYTSYGIAAGPVIVHDISADRAFVERLVHQFELYQLAPEHLRDAVEDALILSCSSTGSIPE